MTMPMPSERQVATQRFGLGPAGTAAHPRGSATLAEVVRELDRPAAALIADPTLFGTPALLMAVGEAERRDQRRRKATEAGHPPPVEPAPTGLLKANAAGFLVGRTTTEILTAERAARFRHATTTEAPFLERLVMFWSNHFCVAANKNPRVGAIAGAYEREAIRPNVTGRFVDMLIAVVSHPAMLIYLDNVLSVGPGSKAGRARGVGLNENLAREILELHTLGVDGGYTQTDVTTLARILTGWSMQMGDGREPATAGFRFFPARHEPGAQTLLGHAFREDGRLQAMAALRHIAAHPATARHIATKLARAFVADDPPPTLVRRLEEAFRRSGGDLAVVSRTLAESTECRGPLVQFRKPWEFLVAARRTFGDPATPAQINQASIAMGEPLWLPRSPAGHSDLASAWASAETLKVRLDVAQGIAARLHVDDPAGFARSVFGDDLAPETLQAVTRAETDVQALALLLMSPEFQRR